MGTTPSQAAQDIVARLKGTWHGSYGKACCPAHQDRSPSLSIKAGDKAVLFHCFAGCSTTDIFDALRRHGALLRPDEPGPALAKTPLSGDRIALCRELWRKATALPGTPAQHYLDRRGIGHSTIGRYARAAITYEAEKRITLPALYLPIREKDELIALSRAFLDRNGQKAAQLAEPKRTLGDPKGGAVQIGKIEHCHLNLAEGFEDAESAIAMFGLPGCWSVNGNEFYARLTVPDHIRSITIYSQHGEAAARGIEKARGHLVGCEDRKLDVVLPPSGGDWNDAWRRRG